MRWPPLLLVVVAASWASACGDRTAADAPLAEPAATATSAPVSSPEPPEPPAPIAATACTAQRVETLVQRFIDAFNAGELDVLDSIFGKGNAFRWYSTDGPGRRVSDTDRGSLVRYFKRRHERGERLRLRSVSFNGNSAGYGHFEYRLIRNANDLEPTDYIGKGAAICRTTDVIAVWSMGREA